MMKEGKEPTPFIVVTLSPYAAIDNFLTFALTSEKRIQKRSRLYFEYCATWTFCNAREMVVVGSLDRGENDLTF